MTTIRNITTPDGHLLGKKLAQFCDDAEPKARLRLPELPPRCNSCAFRAGPHLANGSPITQMDALKCLMEGVEFRCHQPAREGHICSGWAMMMLAWRNSLQSTTNDALDMLCSLVSERGGGITPNESGRAYIRRWLKRFSFQELLVSADESFDHYMSFSGDKPDIDSWGRAFEKIPAIASLNRQAVEKPYMPKLAYIQGILRRRTGFMRMGFIEMLEEAHLEMEVPLIVLESEAKKHSTWREFQRAINLWTHERPDSNDHRLQWSIGGDD